MTTSPTPEPAIAPPFGERTVRRIAYLIPLFGVAGGLLAALLHRLDWAEGLVLGSGLAWLNFRWLKRGLEAFIASADGQVSTEKSRPSRATYLAALFRYVLIGLGVYVIFNYLHVPLVSIVLGLCAFAAATITASVWEILQPVE
jgi:ATP synthase I chain